MENAQPSHGTRTLLARADLSPRAPTVRVGLLGCGTVGAPVASSLLDRRFCVPGMNVELARIAVVDRAKRRPVSLPSDLVTTNALRVVKDPSIDVVIELIGGIQPPFTLIRQAIAEGKDVISANKDLMARHGDELAEAAAKRGVHLVYEGAVCAGIPILDTLHTIAACDRVSRITGIVNGTTNFVLTRMSHAGCTLEGALLEAELLGYAERDSRADIDGFDAACKTTILAREAFGQTLSLEDFEWAGIGDLQTDDIDAARRCGRAVKLIATLERRGQGLWARVEPTLFPRDHPLARTSGVDNAVIIEAERGGRLTLQGPGAGGEPTATAVLSDLRRVATRSPCFAGGPRSSERTFVSAAEQSPPRRHLVRCGFGPDPLALTRVQGVLSRFDIEVDHLRLLGERAGSPGLAFVAGPDADRKRLEGVLSALEAEAALKSSSVLPILDEEDP